MRVTASKVGLLEHCQHFALPEVEWSNVPSAAADRGTRFHRAIALYVACAPGVPLSVEEDIASEFAHAKRWVDDLRAAYPGAKVLAEVGFAWDPETDRAEVLEGTDRDYSKGAGRVCGTADLVVVFADAVMIYDWKTGSGENAGPQLRLLGLMAARAYAVDAATVAALEVSASGVTEVAHEHHDDFGLASIAGGLTDLLQFIPGATPRPGDHCGDLYCPARVSCPAMQSAQAELVPEGALVRKLSTTIESPEHAVWMLDRIRLVTSACEEIKKAIKARIPEGGWQMSDGSLLVEGTRDMPRFDRYKATALLKQLGATPEQIAACTYTWTESNGLRVVGGAKPARTRARKTRAA